MNCGGLARAIALIHRRPPPPRPPVSGRERTRDIVNAVPMLRTLDRYVIREIVPPFLLSLLIFTFILEIPPVMDSLEALVAKGVPWSTAGRIILTLIPQALGLTIPMALLVGMLIALGRLSADREAMALLACGVSPYRLLRPIGLLAALGTAATMYVMIVAIPDANQTFREITFDIISKRVENDIRPRVFFEDFPGWVLYARDAPPPGQPGWKDVVVANTTRPDTAEIYFARRGQVVLDRQRRRVDLVLSDGTSYKTPKPGESDTYRFPGDLVIQLDANTVFQRGELPRGITELTIAQLREEIDRKVRNQISPHPEIMAIHAKFSIPAACLVFAVIALALGLTVAREGKLAGFVVGIGVIFAYYVVMFLSESMAKGQWMPPALARWIPNVVLGPLGVAALVWRARYADGRLPRRLPFRFPSWLRRRGESSATPAPRAAAPGRRRVVLVVRVPRIWTPMPGLIDRYISRLYLRVVGISFLALLGLFYISTFIDKSDKVFKGQASAAMVATLLVYMTPQFVYYVIPLSALLSVLITFGVLTRNSELTVMKACGISLYRASVAVVLLSLVFSAVLYGMEQQLLARANRHAEELDARIRGRPPRTSNPANRRWIIGPDGAIYHYGYFDPDRKALTALTIYRPDPNQWALASTTFVNRAAYNGGWQADRGWTQDYAASRPKWESFTARPLSSIEPPDYFEAEQPLPEMMTVAQLRREVAELSASGFNSVPLAVELQRKLAFPFVTFVMTLLAVPFGVTAGKRGTVYGVGLGIMIALAYWIGFSAFIAIGKAGLLSPALAAWAPNIIVFGGATYLFLTART
jgi:LPS export ABC transporter permease LptG/LPS export ABC transporter permease LptF